MVHITKYSWFEKKPDYNETHPEICKPINSSIFISVCVSNCFLLNQRTYKYWHIFVNKFAINSFITINSSLRFRCAMINSDATSVQDTYLNIINQATVSGYSIWPKCISRLLKCIKLCESFFLFYANCKFQNLCTKIKCIEW